MSDQAIMDLFNTSMAEAGNKRKPTAEAYLNVKIKNSADEWKSLRGIPLSTKRKTDKNLLAALKQDADVMAKLIKAGRIEFSFYDMNDDSETDEGSFLVD